ncbi:branched-chain amino acid transporter permease [Clostridium sp.]|jgi:branched-subunit amino acid transport protein AzlD|uniref:branched-chain amino acid transporter permease n=1 Tax=Clostridium sp. TaxID=1506 RepID=UPI002FDE577F
MGINNEYTIAAILIMAAITFGTRVVPFVFWGRDKVTPKYIAYIGNYLPPAIIAMLIVYCLRNVSLHTFPFGIPEAIGIITVAVLHIWKRNNLISILSGTIVYMIAVQVIFV